MIFKFYYYDEFDSVLLIEMGDIKPDYQTLKLSKDAVFINLTDKNVENLYDFFKKEMIKVLLLDKPSEIKLDYSDIESKEFFNDPPFIKLIDLIKNLLEKCNETIIQLEENNGGKNWIA